MNQLEVMQLTATLKGCPLSCFFAFVLLRSTLSPKELATITDYHVKTVRSALQKLRFVGLATTTGNERWMLTDAGYQLPLGTNELATVAAGVPKGKKNSSFLDRSSSYHDSFKESSSHEFKTTTTGEREEKFLPFDITTLSEPTISVLTARWAVPKAQAKAVVTEALNLAHLKGIDLDLAALILQWEILLWLAWYFSEHGKGINNMPAFIVAKIQNYELPPDWFTPEPSTDLHTELLNLEKQISDKEQAHDN